MTFDYCDYNESFLNKIIGSRFAWRTGFSSTTGGSMITGKIYVCSNSLCLYVHIIDPERFTVSIKKSLPTDGPLYVFLPAGS